MTVRRAMRAVVLAVLLAGCVTPTPYQPYDRDGGYDEQRAGEGHVAVRFTGNTKTPHETVALYLLYRCAELTLAAGYPYFQTRGGVQIASWPASFKRHYLVGYADVWMHTDRPADTPNVYDAAAVIRGVRRRLERP